MKRPEMLMLLLSVILFSVVTAQNSNRNVTQIPVGIILDSGTLLEKMSRTSMALAVEDFYKTHSNYSTRLVFTTRDSYNDDVQATLTVLDLLKNMSIRVILGPQKSSQAFMVAKICNKSQVPVVSFSATSPTLTSKYLPYFVRTTINDAAQLNAIASLIKAYKWQQVVPIYEDTDFGRDIIPFLVDVLEQINVQIPYRSVLPPTDDQIEQELYKLQTMQTRVFIVHMTSSRGAALFLKAKELGMMSDGYVWIMTDGVKNMVDFFNSSVSSAMTGALGVRLYVPYTDKLDDFITRWKKRFHEDNPQDMYTEPSIYALWAYDTIFALAMAVEKAGVQNTRSENSTTFESLPVYSNGLQLLEAISNTQFRGLSGKFELQNRDLQFSAFEIINCVGRGISRVGYWRKEEGLSKELDGSNNKTYSTSQSDLNMVIWPGKSSVVPKGWDIPVSGTKLRVGVTEGSYNAFSMVEVDPETNATTASGYSIDVFEEAIKRLPYAVSYEYEYFGDGSRGNSKTANDFVYQVYLGKYDMVIGDITIRYNRTLYADFSVPYTESGVAMIVPVKHSESKNTFVFLQPLSLDLWLGSFLFLIYIGITISILESKIKAPIRRSVHGYIGDILYLSLFSYQEKLESILSKIVSIVSVFILLVLASSYTANLSSMLTVQKLEPTVTDVQSLITSGDYVGYPIDSFVEGLLEQHGFDKSKMKAVDQNYGEELDKGSANGGVAAVIDEIPYIKLFLSKQCNSYRMVPIYKTAGFGFAFPKGSPLVPDISQAILNITDGDNILRIEKKWIGENQCQDSDAISMQSSSRSLTFVNFGGLFGLCGFVCTVSLLVFATISLYKKQSNTENPAIIVDHAYEHAIIIREPVEGVYSGHDPYLVDETINEQCSVGAASSSRDRQAGGWLTGVGFTVLTCNSVLAIYRSNGDVWSAAFVVSAYFSLLLLFWFLRLYEKAVGPERGKFKVGIWLLSAFLTSIFSYKVAALMPWLLALAVSGMAAATITGGFYALFIYHDGDR